ncbi:MAG: hypothetical protein K0S23_3139 [Fluviicola sp.]|nr:hypothetical protein [Fluviicola sp.]
MEGCNRTAVHSVVWNILLSISFIFTFESYSQNAEHLFPYGGWVHYVGVGNLDGKRIVSDIRVMPKDSTNREIHVIIEILTDWKISDSLEVDLVLDPTLNSRITTSNKEVETVRYRLKDSDIFVDFEKPVLFTSYTQDKELTSYWASHYAWINFPQRLKKYQEVLEVYFEK